MKYLITLFLLITSFAFSQVKVGGHIVDEQGEPIPFANIIFKGSTEGGVSDENGKFYIESENTYTELMISFLGFETKIIPLKARNFDLKIVLKEDAAALDEVLVYSGKTKKKGNPAVEILKKIWAKKRQNGLRLYKQYEYDKYEKIEFDLNNIDEKFKKKRLFKGMEFVFEKIDTSNITGKPYLPIFINEALYKVYGKNKPSQKSNETLIANKNSGFDSNQELIEFVKQLYVDYNIYDNYLKFFDKSFTSPLSRTGVSVYNYVLADSAYLGNKWCYNIVFYPRRKNELTFKGDFWVNDTTFAIQEIEMNATRSANINWVKEIYVAQEFEVLSDSVFLLKRDHMMSDFSFNSKDKSKGVYGRRTTLYNNYEFEKERDDDVYKAKVSSYEEEIYNKPDDFWSENRMEKLNKDEVGVYKMLDTLKTVRKFKQLYNVGATLATGYWQIFDGFDYGPLFSSFGSNDIEGFRVRVGGRTYFSQNDTWRIQGYAAYGFKDDKVKYGISGKWLVDKRNRIILSLGNRRDIEQTGVSLTTANDVLSRSFASSSFFSRGDNYSLTNVNLTNLAVDVEPIKNLNFRLGATYKTLSSAAPDSLFNVSYFDKNGFEQAKIKQTELDVGITYTPGRKTAGFGVERNVSNEGRYPTVYLSYTKGLKGFLDSDFDYDKLQLYYRHRVLMGGFGKLKYFLEVGKTFGEVPLTMLDVVPGNQAIFTAPRTFDLLNYYDFVTDEYAALHIEHNFNGRIFSRIPLLRKLNWREIAGVRAVIGNLSDKNVALSAFDLQGKAPTKPYYEYFVGVDNIFKFIRIDFVFRGNYLDMPGATKFAVKGGFGFYF
ncbi:carboxypeptidase-like regulatory domain-containing protein [Aureibaculum algae]|uniref:Carboxypeptidase-like regulatory domain-containing protein n=1 Tax=Aureibaculum algae TaxID=2584122 RepID=A0A5B7TMT8_9FLAO|nr:DUF5686 and carboxypeptidase-like regulatory domain-containing protein [Aureibaculum algae]QCX37510.1 carboxypeptidase-like regulatory domain-containing protein [Aureibaculum algae]